MKRYAVIAVLLALAIVSVYFYSRKPLPTPMTDVIPDTSSTSASSMVIESDAFEDGDLIPAKFTCDGSNVSPTLIINGVPEDAKSLALIMDDPDVPTQVKPDGMFVHWILFNIPPETREIREGATIGSTGANGSGKAAYTGPCPPPQYEPKEHRYFFKIYALDSMLDLPEGATKEDVEAAMNGRILSQATLMGRYARQ